MKYNNIKNNTELTFTVDGKQHRFYYVYTGKTKTSLKLEWFIDGIYQTGRGIKPILETQIKNDKGLTTHQLYNELLK